MRHAICNTDHTAKNFSKVMHITIIIATGGTGATASSPWFDAVSLIQF
jgi:molybdopterin biosynthesis enzyme MoaB